MLIKERLKLRLDRLGDQITGSSSQQFSQRIGYRLLWL
jgi:hypothetical protein